jgi:hypothetical protein
VSGTLVQLTWRDNSTDETSFRIERRTGTGVFGEVRVTGPNAATVRGGGQTPGLTYTYRVRALGRGFSRYCGEASVTASPWGANRWV